MIVKHFSLKNQPNVGDANCAPIQYFDLPGEHIDLLETGHKADLAIFGGGAISGRAARYQSGGRKVFWGGGHTVRGAWGNHHLTHNTGGFELYGTRDFGHGIWVPCASCMSPLFNKPKAPSQDIVFYGHAELSPMGDKNNNLMDFEAVINHLASGETVVTSSYHGMYWALLLGRRVVVKPFGAKFFGLPYKMQFVEEYMGQIGFAHPAALDECRAANIDFYEKVKKIL